MWEMHILGSLFLKSLNPTSVTSQLSVPSTRTLGQAKSNFILPVEAGPPRKKNASHKARGKVTLYSSEEGTQLSGGCLEVLVLDANTIYAFCMN